MSDAEARLTAYRAFLEEYKALCEKHGLIVEACGCCRSPWIRGQESSDGRDWIQLHADHLKDQIK